MKLIGINENKKLIRKNFGLILGNDNDIILILNIILITSIKIWSEMVLLIFYDKFAPVAQLDRALGYGPGGSGFKS